MSKITNDCLTWSVTGGCFIAVPMATVGVTGLTWCIYFACQYAPSIAFWFVLKNTRETVSNRYLTVSLALDVTTNLHPTTYLLESGT